MYAIVIFCYRRLSSLEQLLEQLDDMDVCEKFEIIIFQDGRKTEHDSEWSAVNNFLKKNKKSRNYTYFMRDRNLGLKNNILNGLDYVASNFDGFVVLEDDLVLDKNFLRWMYYCLDRYESSDVFHINGYSPNMPFGRALPVNFNFLGKAMYCWGWGTWSIVWKKYLRFEFQSEIQSVSKFRLNQFGANDIYEQYYANRNGALQSWAVYWYLSVYFSEGRTISPFFSLVANNGFYDGTNSLSRDARIFPNQDLNLFQDFPRYTIPFYHGSLHFVSVIIRKLIFRFLL
jgi:hypothetical protein